MATNTDPTIQFFDNFIPKLHSGKYEISVQQTLKDASGNNAITIDGAGQVLTQTQKFEIKGPKYQIPAADVHATFPANNLSGRFEEVLPHVVFNKKVLPWEQLFDPNHENVPWVALLALQIGSGAEATAKTSNGKVTNITLTKGGIGYHEMSPTISIIDNGGNGLGAVITATIDADTGTLTGLSVSESGSGYSDSVSVKIGYPSKVGAAVGGANQTGAITTTPTAVATAETGIVKPAITTSNDSPCQAINVAVEAFQNYMPQYDPTATLPVDEVSMLAHVRQVSMHDKAKLGLKDGWCASVMAKRFPVAPTNSVNYAVHVVSLLGLTDYLKSGANFNGSNIIQLISLYSWSFTCQPDPGESFKQLMMDLLTTEEGTGFSLQLPSLPISRGAAPAEAAQKATALVKEGYVPMKYHTRLGEDTMALYRSPLTPVLPKNIFRRSVTDIKMIEKGSGYTTVPVVTVSGGGIEVAAVPDQTSLATGPINTSSAGSGYLNAPAVQFSNPNAEQAIATAEIGSGGSLSGIQIVNGGKGYSSTPTVIIQGGGIKAAQATAYLEVSGITIGTKGTGYSQAKPPVVSIQSGGGSGATAEATVADDGSISVQLISSGQGYTSVPTVSIEAPASGTTATATVTMALHKEIQLTSGGFGYTSVPEVTIAGGSTANAIVQKGQITKIQVTQAGQGYTTPPAAVITGGGFSVAEAAAVISGGIITSIKIAQAGGPYAFPPDVVISGGGVQEPTAIANMSNGTVESITITDVGQGFSGTTNIELVGGQRAMMATANLETVVGALTIGTSGTGYTSPPTVTISAPSNGTAAKALAQISNGAVSGLVITSHGSGYTSAPTVTIGPPNETNGTQATATASIVTQVGSLNIEDPGSGYTYPPTITIAAPAGGTQAVAEAYIDDPISSSTGVAIYNKKWGVFDLSYSSLFLNARLLALNSKSFAINVIKWRKEAHQLVNNLYERLASADIALLEALPPEQLQTYLQSSGNATGAFMTKLTSDYAKKLIPKFSQPIKSGSMVNGDIPSAPTSGNAYDAIEDLKQLLNHKSIQAQLQNLSGYDGATGTFTNDRFKDICEWLASLALLEGVPFEILVPDERMLPAGSIRFFYLDPNAIEALIDGALSVGTHSSRDTLYYTLMRGVIRNATKTLIHQLRANLLGNTPQAPPFDDQPITGFLLRSPVVKGWPGLEVKAYKSISNSEGSESIPLIRMDHISKDILLCLFDGVPEWVQLDEPSEGLTFGVEDGNTIYLRNLTGDSVGAVIKTGSEDETVSINGAINSATGQLNISELITILQSALESQLNLDKVVRIESDGGENYATAPTVQLNNSTVTGLTAQIDGLAAVIVSHGGSGYTESPTIAITDSGGGTGSGAEAIAVVENGKVTAIQLLNPGENYTNPVVTITPANGGPGSGAEAIAEVATGQVTGFLQGPFSFTGTPSPPTVSFTGGTAITGKAITVPNATAYLGTLGPADLAVEMVKLPERMIFRTPQSN
tara:strand:- start:47315 stop:51787 length:4473 start_codon:yes stop_codon:yes gene_type:complete